MLLWAVKIFLTTERIYQPVQKTFNKIDAQKYLGQFPKTIL